MFLLLVGTPSVENCGYTNGGCDQVCLDDGNHVVCDCIDGYDLGSGGKTCIGTLHST